MKIHEIYKIREEKLKEVGMKSYQEYLNGEEWKTIRQRVKLRIGKKWNFCNICGSGENLNIHHSSYKVIGQEHPGNTIKVLCQPCHHELHQVSKDHPGWSFYKTCGRIRSYRKKHGLPIFTAPQK